MVKVRNIPITQSMIAQLKYNVITFNGRLSIPGVAFFLFIVIPTFSQKLGSYEEKSYLCPRHVGHTCESSEKTI